MDGQHRALACSGVRCKHKTGPHLRISRSKHAGSSASNDTNTGAFENTGGRPGLAPCAEQHGPWCGVLLFRAALAGRFRQRPRLLTRGFHGTFALYSDKYNTPEARCGACLQQAQMTSQQQTTNEKNERKAARELQRGMTRASGAIELGEKATTAASAAPSPGRGERASTSARQRKKDEAEAGVDFNKRHDARSKHKGQGVRL